MAPDDLRALADALEPMAKAPRFEDFDVPGFCAWVRACADAEPVGYVTANGLRSLRQDDATVLLYAHDYLIRPDHVALYTHPAPAAPQIDYRALYHDLLFAVGNKHAGETRHETALRYIREAERSDGAALAVKENNDAE